MKFEVTQRFGAPVPDVSAAFADPDLYQALAGLPKLGRPEVLDHTANADGTHVQMRVRYRFTGDLSAAARAVVDPDKLTWVEVADHDLTAHRVSFVLEPDNYADRFKCSGRYRFDPAPDAPDATVRTAGGEVKVRMALVAGSVERAIVSGLKEHLAAETALVERWLSGR